MLKCIFNKQTKHYNYNDEIITVIINCVTYSEMVIIIEKKNKKISIFGVIL